MKIKPTPRSAREFEFLLACPLDMIGQTVGQPTTPAVPGGLSALECWYALDTHGRALPCREPAQLDKALRSKKSINLQIKLWAQDIADGMLLRQHELTTYLAGWPLWIFHAVMEQAAALLLACPRIGYVPRFARMEYFQGSLWIPEMDAFDPCI